MNDTSLHSGRAFSSTSPFDVARFGLAVAGAVVLNLALYGVGKAGGASMTIDSAAYDSISLLMVGVATALSLGLAGSATWFLSRRWPSFRRTAQMLGVVIALLSMASPFIVANDTATALTLVGMHLVGATAWFFGLDAK